MNEDVETILESANLTVELMGLALDYTGAYLTFLFGYLVATYTLGKQLRVSHAVLLTVLFVYWSVINTTAAYMSHEAAAHYSHTYALGRSPKWAGLGVAFAQIFGTLAAVFFMWSIRHRKDE